MISACPCAAMLWWPFCIFACEHLVCVSWEHKMGKWMQLFKDKEPSGSETSLPFICFSWLHSTHYKLISLALFGTVEAGNFRSTLHLKWWQFFSLYVIILSSLGSFMNNLISTALQSKGNIWFCEQRKLLSLDHVSISRLCLHLCLPIFCIWGKLQRQAKLFLPCLDPSSSFHCWL